MSAYTYPRRRKDGSTALQVKWRDPATARWSSETFDGAEAARAAGFRAAVEAAGRICGGRADDAG